MTTWLSNSVSVQEVAAEEYEEWLDRFLGAFGHAPASDAGVVEFFRATHPPHRAIAVTDDAGVVATGSAIDVDLVLPGGGLVPMAGVTGLTVDPTATRRGVLRAMMAHLHQRAAAEGRPIAGLGASEWPIYGRFGYGPATWFDAVSIDARQVGWRPETLDETPRPHRLADKQAPELAQALHERQARLTPGEVRRPDGYWQRLASGSGGALDTTLGLAPGDAGPLRRVAIDGRGLVVYRVSSRWSAHGTPEDVLWVTDLLTADTEAEAALWRHLLTVDLVSEIRVSRVAVDHPLRWWVADARRLRPRRHDGLWLRPLDVPRLLEARSWSGSGGLTITVHDDEGYAQGTFRLEVESGHGAYTRSTGQPDLEMGVAALGAILLGGTSATELARGGQIAVGDASAAQRWDALATPATAPFSSWAF